MSEHDTDLNDVTSTRAEIHQYLAIRADRVSKFLAGLVIATLIVATTLFGVGLYEQHVVGTQWNPLGAWAVQTVKNGPVIHLGQTVNVVATKCAHETVRARGGNEWQQVTDVPGAPGIIVTGTEGVGLQVAGCHTFQYYNQIPVGVQAVVKQIGKSRWQITGTSTPFKATGEVGEPRSWQTETFTLAP